jgi:hypothetical protein
LKGSPASRGQKKRSSSLPKTEKNLLSTTEERKRKKTQETRTLGRETTTHSSSLYFTTLLVLKCRLRCQHRPRRSGANSLCIRFVSSRRLSGRSFYYSLVVRESFSRFHLSISLFWGEIFSSFYLSKGAPGVKMAEIFQARAAIKTRVNAFKRESLSAQKIERVSLVLLVLASAVLRERNRSFFAIEKKRDTRERWFFRVDVTRFFSWGKEITQIFRTFF